ncbi:MAG: TlpA family protein disulfide reductase [Ectothiorhodospiraceae bacterium]|nr:TlpA family protein disulfide reductase [Ectothiorhodospiraceae bacterium]
MLIRHPRLRAILLTLFTLLSLLSLLSSPVSANEEPAPEFTLPTLPNNAEINLKDFRGRVVLLDFWATWCPPCRRSFPWMDEMHSRYEEDGLTIIAVSVDKKRDLIERFIQQMDPAFTVAHDPTGDIARSYRLRAMPTSYLIDREGNLVTSHMGFRSRDKVKLETEIQDLLEK